MRRLAESGPRWSALFKAQILLWIMLVAVIVSQIARLTPTVPAAVSCSFAKTALAVGLLCSCPMPYLFYRVLWKREPARPFNKRETRVLIPLWLVVVALLVYDGYRLSLFA